VSALRYQPFYCEENVFHLCSDPRLSRATLRVVFVSNAERAVALLHQRAARAPGEYAVWDYHVFLLARDEGDWSVWDLDTTLDMPTLASAYLERTFEGLSRDATSRFAPRFRVIDAQAFVARFCSDRSHMRTRGGRYLHEPPPWPTIVRDDEAPNLMRFADVSADFIGQLMNLDELRVAVGPGTGL
jgi:hypothetical protein